MSCSRYTRWFLAVAAFFALAPAFAVEPVPVEPVPITADQAFNAVVTQKDPMTKQDAAVALVDVRSRAEYYWVGTAAKVDEIVLKGNESRSVKPDWGKVKLAYEGRLLEYRVRGKPQWMWVDKVAELKTSPIAVNIPYRLWDEKAGKLLSDTDPGFEEGISALAGTLQPQGRGALKVLIVFCRSGGRSTSCIVNFDGEIAKLFDSIYEIDDPSKATGVGGFEGPGYKEAYNGYLGFPGRRTNVQDTPSVSWKDAGLPIKIGAPLPPLPPVQ